MLGCRAGLATKCQRGILRPSHFYPTLIFLPRYDKSAYGGRGAFAPVAQWPSVQGPLDVALFEVWTLGFAMLPGDAEAKVVDKDLVAVNRLLRQYQGAWDSLVDSWLVIRIGDPHVRCDGRSGGG